ncbi:MAG: hypothetical protein AB1607_05525 [Chloroflexota bacterium]
MTDIFISVGRISASEEDDFLHAVENILKSHGLNPRTVGRTDFADENPFQKVLHVMKECSGIIVIASERMVFERGIEFPKSIEKTGLRQVFMPTIWNQIEAAMAYALHLPMLVIAESSLRPDGFLEREYDWLVLRWGDLLPEHLNSAEFLSVFEKWKTKVADFAGRNQHLD